MNAMDLRDIQGNIVRAYGRYGFPHARYFLFHIATPSAGRRFIADLLPKVTTSERWRDNPDGDTVSVIDRPKVTLNVSLSWKGLQALDLPTQTLTRFPREFIDGMAARALILSDLGPSSHSNWDKVWRDPADGVRGTETHVLVNLNAQMREDGTPVPELDEMTDWLRNLGATRHITLLTGHNRDGGDYQQAGAHLVEGLDGKLRVDNKEHFGFVDGIGNPVFEGQYPDKVEDQRTPGRGKIMPDQSWKPIATGEFLLGHADESQELPHVPEPPLFTRNGTFLCFRKLHENPGMFRKYMRDQAETYAHLFDVAENEADITLRAKMVGRWPNGVPLMVAPTYAEMLKFDHDWADIPDIRAKTGHRTPAEQTRLDAYKQLLIDFKYRDDQQGVKCPISAHIRRGNMRDMLDPMMTSKNPKDWTGSALTNRRRILRRGLPYGAFDFDNDDDSTERGVIFIAMCADIQRQFEFVQQQWINFGMDFNAGNDTCPLLGYHQTPSKFMVQADPDSGQSPWMMTNLPQFVETRGGDYFFVPSLNTLNMMAHGLVDPT